MLDKQVWSWHIPEDDLVCSRTLVDVLMGCHPDLRVTYLEWSTVLLYPLGNRGLSRYPLWQKQRMGRRQLFGNRWRIGRLSTDRSG